MKKQKSSKFIDPERSLIQKQLNSSLKHLRSLKDELFPTQIDLMGDSPKKSKSPKRPQEDYYFEKFEFMHHNKDIKQAIHELASSPDGETIGGEFQVIGEPLETELDMPK